ncbi:hypothetical protein ARMSODRAFT_465939 [Armillaria solidipes]|uniref:Uncharacterized protein n=1 Tax=Armillaria solidipes TaxID=1076256 RepID=A0A2H3B0X8_9AGAR|nr:hypothetical protein ARMSODRAFT_465939 [Armillaria solidipes]
MKRHSEGASVDIVPRSHFTLCQVITDGPGYSLQKAEMRSGKIATIKVFTGCKAKLIWEEAVKFDLKVMHPNLPHLIGTSSSDSERPFSVYDLDIKDRVEGVVQSWMRQDVDEIMYMCAIMIRDISSALNNLSEQARLFDLGAEGFDILWDTRGRVVLAAHPEVASSSTTLVSPEDHTSRPLRVMDNICVNIFRSVNHIRYDDNPIRISSSIREHEETISPVSSPQPLNSTVIQPRRELFWQAAVGSVTDLRKITQQYGSFVRRDMCHRRPVRRFYATSESTTNHQCNGYQREELILAHAILDNKVVVHATPCFDEICVVCGKHISKRDHTASNNYSSITTDTEDSVDVDDEDDEDGLGGSRPTTPGSETSTQHLPIKLHTGTRSWQLLRAKIQAYLHGVSIVPDVYQEKDNIVLDNLVFF